MDKNQEHALWALREALRLCEAADVHVHPEEDYDGWRVGVTVGGGCYCIAQLEAEDVDNLISQHQAELLK